MSEQDIEEGIQLLRKAAEKFEISPEVYYRATVNARPNSRASRAAELEMELLDLKAEITR